MRRCSISDLLSCTKSVHLQLRLMMVFTGVWMPFGLLIHMKLAWYHFIHILSCKKGQRLPFK